ncbi:hypothetical protein GGI12_000752 [Dipsacomyces acuminosporus]|nr:hypothetical protein GGI12_000752 [Dipsacomyces acuminosporus]
MKGVVGRFCLYVALVSMSYAHVAEARLRSPSDLRLYSPRRLHNTRASACTPDAINNPGIRNPPPMRLKQPSLCDPDVRQHSGYLDMDDKHVFFWYFGSRKRLASGFSAAKDSVPLVFWFSGGPGCSSQIANWQENGPCTYAPSVPFDSSISDGARKLLPHKVKRNPHAWNKVADIVFLDQPVGTGFSYGPTPNSTEASADTAWRAMQAIYAFLSTEARKNNEAPIKDVRLFGESYAGRYIPVFSEYLLHMNEQVAQSTDLQNRGFVNLPLQGIGIGNGMFDYRLQTQSYHPIACNSTYPPLFTKKQCSTLKNSIIPTCNKALDSCYSTHEKAPSSIGMRDSQCLKLEPEPWRTSDACSRVSSNCDTALSWTTAISIYDVRPKARMVPDDYVKFVQSSTFTDAVGVPSNVRYSECSDAVFDRFASTFDELSRSATSSLEYILEQRIPVLLYSGDGDFICNWYGTAAVAQSLNWHGREKLLRSKMTKWHRPDNSTSDVEAGQYAAVENFTFLRIYEAGHEVPYYQPEAALHMFSQFLDNKGIS